jgi:hypothetical protein
MRIDDMNHGQFGIKFTGHFNGRSNRCLTVLGNPTYSKNFFDVFHNRPPE